jgi:hypothetical protein
MASPVLVACAADVWTKVATAITSAQIFFEAASPGPIPSFFRVTYRATGEAAPVNDLGVIVACGSNSDGGQPSYRAEHLEPVDVYLFPVGGPGLATRHSPFGTGAVETGAEIVCSEVAIVAAPVGGINVPGDDGIVMDGYSSIGLQVYLKGGQSVAHVDRVLTAKIQGSDDAIAGAARVWVDLAVGYDLAANATAATWVSTGLTAKSTLIDLEGYLHSRIRINYSFDAAPHADHPGSVIINSRSR